MGILLFIVSIVLAAILFPLGIAWAILKKLGTYFRAIALSVDQMGNVVMQDLFNDTLITKKGHKFGDEDETISSVLGKNKKKKTLRRGGEALVWLLHKLDDNHSINSIE